ncbi:MAG TPA: MFS transporter, partial [Mycobacteriales bacterium]|nr:MFS transporter [Mycobacteriales bacterium]
MEPDPHRWRALSVCLVAGFMTLLDVSIVNVALPSIRTGLRATDSDLQWVLSGYALTFGLVLVPSGRFGDAYGRRLGFMAGLAAFTVASAAAGLSPGPGWLVVARLVQGASAGLLTPQIAGLIQQLFTGAERGRAFGLLGASIGVSTAVGPLLGGLIISAAGAASGWRWIFYVNVPVGIAALPLAHRLVPIGPARHRRPSLDPVGVVLLGSGVFLLLLPLVEYRQWTGRSKWWLFAGAVVALAGFVGWERRYRAGGGEPVADLGLFRVRSYSLGSTLALLYFAGFTSIFFTFTLFLQIGLGYSALLAGAAVTPFALGSAAASGLGGRSVSRFGRHLVAVGLLLVLAGLAGVEVAVHQAGGHGVALATAVPLLVAGVGSGLVIAPNQTITLSEVPVRGAGSAAGVLQTGQRIGTAVGIATVGSLFFATVTSSHGDFARAFDDSLSIVIAFVVAALAAAVADLAASRWGLAPAARRDQPAGSTAVPAWASPTRTVTGNGGSPGAGSSPAPESGCQSWMGTTPGSATSPQTRSRPATSSAVLTTA